MEEYEKINNEIKQLMNTKVKPLEYVSEDDKKSEGNVDQLIKILSDLIRIYKDIQLMLESNDNEGVKQRLLSDDIKISLVCESLMKVLKDECSEKKELNQQLENEKSKNKSLECEVEEIKHKYRKMESDMEYLRHGNKELSRIIQDQKSRVQSFKDKAELEKKGADSIKMINKELENLRLKAMEKNEILVKEINILKAKLDEKDKTIKKVNEEMKEKERMAKSNSEKAMTLEKNFSTLKKKLEAKEEAFDVCNSELASLITKNKRCEAALEDLKGKSAYYERLYKAINKQNEYLNEQLAKLINVENAGRIEISHNENDYQVNDTLVTATSDLKKIKGYKRKVKKYKKRYFNTQEEIERNKEELKEIQRAIERLRMENKRLQEEKEKAIDSNNNVTDTLLKKVEYLLEKNRQYQKMIYEQQEASTQANESFKTVIENSPKKLNQRDLEGMFNDIKLKNTYDTKIKVKDFDSSTLFIEDLKPKSTKYQRSFKLHNEYDLENKPREIILPEPVTVPRVTHSIPENFYTGLLGKKPVDTNFNDFKLTDKESEESEIKSVDSGKSLQTTSTLKAMMKKTENLQNKFEDLEKQLDEIKQSEEPQPKKLHDQIKAYTDYYYSDHLDFSNEDDFL